MVQTWVGTLCQKAAYIVLIAGDTRIRNIRRVRMAVVGNVAYGQALVINDLDRGGVAE